MLSYFLKLTLTLAAFWLVSRQVEWRQLQDAFTRQQPAYLTAAACAIFLQIISGALRWHHIRSALATPGSENPTRTMLIYYASSFFNVIMPSTLGSDLARTWLARQAGGTLTQNVSGVLIDRIMSLAGLALLVASTLPILCGYLGVDPRWGFAGAVLCWIMAIGGYLMLRLLVELLGGFRHLRFIGSAIDAITQIIGKHHHIIGATLWAASAHICYATATYALAMGLGMNISWVACLVLVPLVLFISTLPISLGGWGIRELSMAGVLALAHISSAPAVVLSIQLGLLTSLISALGGVCYLILKRPPVSGRP